ncbi:MAG: Crp/Fnr family transcriptional regulator [Bacteroidia bacterium]
MTTQPDIHAGINAYIRRCLEPTDEELAFFDSLLTFKRFEKKSILLHEGDICEYESYIIKGCVRAYFTNENGFEVTLLFAVEDWWVSDLASFHEGKPAKITLETLEPTELLMLNRPNKELLLERYPKFERMYRLMLQRSLGVMQERLLSTLSKPAQERYQEFLERYPHIPQRVAQHYIASYLGVSPEFLSKIRGRMNH